MDNKDAGMPRWVKISLAAAAIVTVLIVAALMLGGEHGPGRHMPSHGLDGVAPASAIPGA